MPRAVVPVIELKGTGKTVKIGAGRTPVIVGERINPTNRKELIAKLKAGEFEIVGPEAKKQVQNGADVLDINVGVPGIDEKHAMLESIRIVQETVDVPLWIDTSNPEVLAAALKAVKGRPGINSTTGEEKRMDVVVPLAAEYGAALVGLCIDDAGIPQTSEKRVAIARKIIENAEKHGLDRKNIIIDCVALACGTGESGAKATLDTIRICTEELGVNTTVGLSNVSFGLPDRPVLNAAFMLLCAGQGMTCFIGNPNDPNMAVALKASKLFWGEDKFAMGYLTYFRKRQAELAASQTK
ncbi:MAG: dihydropteroate synthase [Thermoplasmatota archaeon]|nr:dihydropteroate synthase [Candidatus Thermoplasmatota archaeon]MBU1915265.1 dihydropteroate synthase [Candidatus Thermoplasmatota archaeon]